MTQEQFYALLGAFGVVIGAAFWMGVRYGGLRAGQDQHSDQIKVILGILADQTKTVLAQSQTLTALASDFSRFHTDYEGARYRDRFTHIEGAMRGEIGQVHQGLARVEALLIAHGGPGIASH